MLMSTGTSSFRGNKTALPAWLNKLKTCINVGTAGSDDCFACAIISVIYFVDKHAQHITSNLEKHSKFGMYSGFYKHRYKL